MRCAECGVWVHWSWSACRTTQATQAVRDSKNLTRYALAKLVCGWVGWANAPVARIVRAKRKKPPKQVFVYPLRPDCREVLTAPQAKPHLLTPDGELGAETLWHGLQRLGIMAGP